MSINRRDVIKLAAVAPFLTKLRGQTPTHGTMTPVLTRSYSNARDCVNTTEKVLTPANVKGGLRQYFTLPMEGDARGAEAQPLILPSVPCSDGVTHDLLIACSMNNLVYAFDANDSAIVWVKKLGYPVKGSRAIDMWGINDHWGALSTPVIDPETYRLYLVPWLSPDGTPQNAEHHIVEMDIRTGDILKSTGLNTLTYDPGHGLPVQTWRSRTMRKQRSSLLLTKTNGVKTVFFASGAVLETAQGASGWVVAYDCSSSKVSACLAMTSHWYGGGIWMGGQGLAADSQGFIYGVTGNGSFDAVTDFSECCIKMQYTPPQYAVHATMTSPTTASVEAQATATGKLQIVDWWSPYSDAGRVGQDPTWPTINYKGPSAANEKLSGVSAPSAVAEGMPVNAMGMEPSGHLKQHGMGSMAWQDQDLGSSGVAIIEKYGIALFSGKDGIAYSGNMHNLGKTQPADFANAAANYAKLKAPPAWWTFYPGNGISATPQDSSQLDFAIRNKQTHHQHSTPVVFDTGAGINVYCCGENGNLRAWRLNGDGSLKYLACSAEYASWLAPGMPGGFMCLSANGTKNALLWVALPEQDANQTVSHGVICAYSATEFGVYGDGSGSMPLLWKSPRIVFNKFMSPVVSGGRLFYSTYDDQVLCFGL